MKTFDEKQFISIIEQLIDYYQKDSTTVFILQQQEQAFKNPQKLIFETFASELILALLKAFEIPHTLTSRYRELRSLFQDFSQCDPQYFRSDQIKSILNKTLLNPSHIEILTHSLTSFLNLCRQTQLFPKKLITPQALSQWLSLFPSNRPWTAFQFLESQGLPIRITFEMIRVWVRFHHGQTPSLQQSPFIWIEEINAFNDNFNEKEISWLLALHALGGGLSHLSISGVCIEIPLCKECPIQTACQWNLNSTASETFNTLERIQEAFIKQQPQWISTSELITTLLNFNEEDIFQLDAFLNSEHVLQKISQSSLQSLSKTISSPKISTQLHSLIELCKRYNEKSLSPGITIRGSQDVFEHFKYRLREMKQEVFILVLLDAQHQYLGDDVITKGLLNKSLVHPREVFSKAIEFRAAAVICVHNHPSGSPKPSTEDLRITERLKEVGQLVGIPVLDHLIIGNDQYTSLADEGLL